MLKELPAATIALRQNLAMARRGIKRHQGDIDNDLIPNALIFLKKNWQTQARQRREREQQADKRSSYSFPRFVVGKIDKE